MKSQDFLVRGEQRFPLEASNVKPEIQQVKIHGGYEVVIYKANISGTTQMVEVYAGAIYDRKSKKIIATPPYEYKGLSAEEQPQWTFSKDGSISVEDPDLPKPRRFPAP